VTAPSDPLRDHVVRLLDWPDAHVPFDSAIDGLDTAHRGAVPPGTVHSPWQLLEHLRLAQQDILEFCINPNYTDKAWPDDYWPRQPEPPSPDAWEESIAAYVRDRDALKQLARDPKVDLFASIPHGKGQTYLRELLLIADHTAYHVGQLIVVRRLLGTWPPVGA
jgi:hypothetical protein